MSYYEDEDEEVPLLFEANSHSKMSRLKSTCSSAARQNVYLVILLIGTVLFGTANRVSFKIMQYSALNYSYFLSLLTTLAYVIVGSVVVIFKLSCTNHITKEQRKIPLYNFLLVAMMDSLAALLIVVGGKDVPGSFQNLLLQGVVPMTMLVSIIFLRPSGCSKCKRVRRLLKKNKMNFEEKSTHPAQCYEDACMSSLVVNGRSIRGSDTELIQQVIDNLGPTNNIDLVLHTSAKNWRRHLIEYFSLGHYAGAAIIMVGLVICVWPQTSHAKGSDLNYFLFFLASLPTALSAVFKEMLFRDVEDLDIWYLTTMVAIFQLVCGLPWAPIAASLTGLKLAEIPMNLLQGINCVFLGTNYISNDNVDSTFMREHSMFINGQCSIKPDCVSNCCDSCDGSIPSISSIRAITAFLIFISVNLAFNLLLVSVIKRGSAALMYIATTLVLPLSALCFVSHTLMHSHARPFEAYDIAGLVLVMLGLMIYRFLSLDSSSKQPFQTMNLYGPTVLRPRDTLSVSETDVVHPRSMEYLRSTFYNKLGVSGGGGNVIGNGHNVSDEYTAIANYGNYDNTLYNNSSNYNNNNNNNNNNNIIDYDSDDDDDDDDDDRISRYIHRNSMHNKNTNNNNNNNNSNYNNNSNSNNHNNNNNHKSNNNLYSQSQGHIQNFNNNEILEQQLNSPCSITVMNTYLYDDDEDSAAEYDYRYELSNNKVF